MSCDHGADICIVVGSRASLVFDCLSSFRLHHGANSERWRVKVVVNDGDPDVAGRLRREFPEVEILVNETPKGFATNHNVALRNGVKPYVAMLNDDLVFVEDTLDVLVDYLESTEASNVGAVSPRLLNPDHSLQHSTYSFPGMMHSLAICTGLRDRLPLRLITFLQRLLFRRRGSSRNWAHDRVCDVNSYRGACVVYRRRALDDCGWLDECSLVGGEETELHMRMAGRRWRVVYQPATEVVHIGQQSVGDNPYLEVEYIKGHLNIHRKHGSRVGFEVVRAAAWLRFLGTRIRGLIGRDFTQVCAGRHGCREMQGYGFDSDLWRQPAKRRW